MSQWYHTFFFISYGYYVGELGALLECRHSKPQRRTSHTSSHHKQTTQQLPFPVLVMHDCRQDSDNLFAEFGVRIKNVFDTQV